MLRISKEASPDFELLSSFSLTPYLLLNTSVFASRTPSIHTSRIYFVLTSTFVGPPTVSSTTHIPPTRSEILFKTKQSALLLILFKSPALGCSLIRQRRTKNLRLSRVGSFCHTLPCSSQPSKQLPKKKPSEHFTTSALLFCPPVVLHTIHLFLLPIYSALQLLYYRASEAYSPLAFPINHFSSSHFLKKLVLDKIESTVNLDNAPPRNSLFGQVHLPFTAIDAGFSQRNPTSPHDLNFSRGRSFRGPRIRSSAPPNHPVLHPPLSTGTQRKRCVRSRRSGVCSKPISSANLAGKAALPIAGGASPFTRCQIHLPCLSRRRPPTPIHSHYNTQIRGAQSQVMSRLLSSQPTPLHLLCQLPPSAPRR